METASTPRANHYKIKKMKKGLNNPALIAMASTPAGQKAITNSLENANAGVNATASIVKGVLKTTLFLTIGWYAYTKIFKGFSKISEDSGFAKSNISTGIAKNKAEAIFSAMYGLGNGFKSVKQTIIGVNHNGFIKIYNEFGQRKGINPLSKNMTLTEWFTDQFSESELMELRFLMPNFF